MGASVAYHLATRGVTDVVAHRTRASARHGLDRAQRRRVSPSVLASRQHRALEGIDRALCRLRGAVGSPHRLLAGRLLVPALLARTASTRFAPTSALQREHGIDVEWLTADDAASLCPGLDASGVVGATYCADDGIADPNGVTMGFARAAQAHGVEIRRGEEVTGIDVEGGRVDRRPDRRKAVSARRTSSMPRGRGREPSAGWPASIVPVDPERRHIFIAQPPRGTNWDEGDHPRAVPASRLMVIDFESTFYFHREGGGMLFGMGDPDEKPGFDTTVRWDFLPQVIEVAVRRLPALADAAVSHAWAGLVRDDARSQPDHRTRRARSKASTRSPASAATGSSTRPPPVASWRT